MGEREGGEQEDAKKEERREEEQKEEVASESADGITGEARERGERGQVKG